MSAARAGPARAGHSAGSVRCAREMRGRGRAARKFFPDTGSPSRFRLPSRRTSDTGQAAAPRTSRRHAMAPAAALSGHTAVRPYAQVVGIFLQRLGEWCGLSASRAPGRVQLLFQPLIFAAEPIPLALEALDFLPQSFNFLIFVGEVSVRSVDGCRSIRAIVHASVMRNLRAPYKDNMLVAPPSAAPTR